MEQLSGGTCHLSFLDAAGDLGSHTRLTEIAVLELNLLPQGMPLGLWRGRASLVSLLLLLFPCFPLSSFFNVCLGVFGDKFFFISFLSFSPHLTCHDCFGFIVQRF